MGSDIRVFAACSSLGPHWSRMVRLPHGFQPSAAKSLPCEKASICTAKANTRAIPQTSKSSLSRILTVCLPLMKAHRWRRTIRHLSWPRARLHILWTSVKSHDAQYPDPLWEPRPIHADRPGRSAKSSNWRRVNSRCCPGRTYREIHSPQMRWQRRQLHPLSSEGLGPPCDDGMFEFRLAQHCSPPSETIVSTITGLEVTLLRSYNLNSSAY